MATARRTAASESCARFRSFARGELRVRGDVDADLGVFVCGEGGEEVRWRAGIRREEGEDLGVLRGLRERFEEMAGGKWIRGDKLLRDGGLGEFGELLEQARGERRLAQGGRRYCARRRDGCVRGGLRK